MVAAGKAGSTEYLKKPSFAILVALGAFFCEFYLHVYSVRMDVKHCICC